MRSCKLNIRKQKEFNFGLHRHGWVYALSSFDILRAEEPGIFFDTFLEQKFCWGVGSGLPYQEAWVGVVHNAPNPPPWYDPKSSNDTLFTNPLLLESLPHCKGIYTLSQYHLGSLRRHPRLASIPLERLWHPTELVDIEVFSIENFLSSPQVLQVGSWLRRQTSIYRLQTPKPCRRIILDKSTQKDRALFQNAFANECRALNISTIENAEVDVLSHVTDIAYDDLLARSVVFLDLFDASANNTVLECLARGTPILVNRIGGVEEYLGSNYPFYFETLEEASSKLDDLELIKQTSHYLLTSPLRQKITRDAFINDIYNSSIYRSL